MQGRTCPRVKTALACANGSGIAEESIFVVDLRARWAAKGLREEQVIARSYTSTQGLV